MHIGDPRYAIEPTIFDVQDLVDASKALASAELQRTKAGARHVLALPAVRALAEDPRMLRLAARFVGERAFPFRATFFDKQCTPPQNPRTTDRVESCTSSTPRRSTCLTARNCSSSRPHSRETTAAAHELP